MSTIASTIASTIVAVVALTSNAAFARHPNSGNSVRESSSERSSPVRESSSARTGAGFNINHDGPRIERGERKNWEAQSFERIQSPVERLVRESPVHPVINGDGSAGFGFHRSF